MAFGVLNKDDFCGKIYFSKKINNRWEQPNIFNPLKNDCVFLPYFSPKGNSIIYASSKIDDINGETDIYIIKKTNNNWNSPKIVKAPFSSNSREANASMANDGTIYFSSNRNCEGKENCFTADLFYSKLVDGTYQKTNVINEFISTIDEESVFISPKEDFIIFCRYTNNKTWMDLYISYLDINKKWTKPRVIDSSINSKDWDRRPFVSIDNKFLFFTRLKMGEKGLTESDIYWVNTSKLFKPYVYNSIHEYFIKNGEKFEISIPIDYFKDIDNNQLDVTLKDKFNGVKFDPKKMTLSGTVNLKKDVELTFEATDKYYNKTESKIILTVL